MTYLFKALIVAGLVILIAITDGFGLFDADQTEPAIIVLCLAYVALAFTAQRRTCCRNGA